MGKKEVGGITAERGQMLLGIGVILGVILIIVSFFVGD